MFGISFSEIILILVVSLIVFGPQQLPQIARSAGRVFLMLQRFMTNFRQEVYAYTGFNEIRQTQQDLLQTYQQLKSSLIQEKSMARFSAETDVSAPEFAEVEHEMYQAELEFDRQPELFE